MCIRFLWYYPEIQSFLDVCGANADFDPFCGGDLPGRLLPLKKALGALSVQNSTHESLEVIALLLRQSVCRIFPSQT